MSVFKECFAPSAFYVMVKRTSTFQKGVACILHKTWLFFILTMAYNFKLRTAYFY